jgi:hypothetical protein
MKEMSIKEFVTRFNNGEFESKSLAVQIEAGWYDWFCNTSALAGKTKTLGKKVASILNCGRFDVNTSYVFFKNNCPCVGALYDHFSICDIETGDVLFCCQHLEKGSHGCNKAHWEIYAREYGFEKPVIQGTWNECKEWFWKINK